MKRTLVITTVLVAGLAVFAQTQSDTNNKQSAAPDATKPAQAAPANPTKPLPQAKSQEEFKAFQETMATIQKGDPAEGETAADAFTQKYKNSEISPILYHRVLQLYQNNNNAEKAIETGKKILAISPNDPIANVLVASLMSERVRETDIDRDERTTEAEGYANKSLQTIDTDFLANPGTPQETIDASKNMIRSMAYAALANCAAAKADNANAEKYFKQASSLPGVQMDSVTWLRYALLLDKEKKYQEALGITNKAFESAPSGSQMQELAKNERERLIMLLGKASAPAATAPATAPKQ